MSKNNSFRFPTTALLNPQPRPAEQKHIGLMLIDEQACAVCGGPVADIHDKFCSKKCVRIKNAKVQQKSINAKKYRAKHLEQITAYKREWHKKNRLKENERAKKYRERCKEVVAARSKKRYDENKEKILAQKKQYYEANKEIISAKLKAKRASMNISINIKKSVQAPTLQQVMAYAHKHKVSAIFSEVDSVQMAFNNLVFCMRGVDESEIYAGVMAMEVSHA